MGYILNLATNASVRSGTSQSNIGTASTLTVKMRIRGDVLLTPTFYALIDLLEIGSHAGVIRADLIVYRDSDQSPERMVFRNSVAGWTCYVPRTSLVSTDYYEIYHTWSSGTPVGEVYSAGSKISTDIASPDPGIGASNSANGKVSVGKRVSGANNAGPGYYDGLAIYSAALAGAARYSAPTAADANILAYWPFDEGTGTTTANAVGGGQALDTWAGTVAWVSAGAWDGAAAPEYVRPQIVTTRQAVHRAATR